MDKTKHKSKKGRKGTNNYKIDQTSSEIPYLSISITESKADFITKSLMLEARGWNIQEAIGGMEYLLEQYKKLQKDKDKSK